MDEFIRRMQEQQKMMQRLTEGSLRYTLENEAAIAHMQGLVAHGVDLSALQDTAATVSASGLPAHLHALADSTATAFAKLSTPEYSRSVMDMLETVERLALPYKEWAAHIETMASCFEATRFTLPTIAFDRIGDLIATADAQSNLVASLTDRLVFRHADLIESLGQPESLLASLPPAIAALPTLDLFVHTTAVRSITPHEPLKDEDEQRAAPLRVTIVTETALYLEQTLPDLKAAFLLQYRGMKARATDRGPDGWTQGSASMRKLLKGVLHTAAPNESVLPWATKNNKPLDEHGRPTRSTKIEWLCQFIPNNAYRAYVRTEINSALALIELVDTAQHVDEFPEFDDQYNWIMLRAEVAIRHILTLWQQVS